MSSSPGAAVRTPAPTESIPSLSDLINLDRGFRELLREQARATPQVSGHVLYDFNYNVETPSVLYDVPSVPKVRRCICSLERLALEVLGMTYSYVFVYTLCALQPYN